MNTMVGNEAVVHCYLEFKSTIMIQKSTVMFSAG